MSGVEALGAVSAIFQTISFAHEVYNLCYDFYNDNPVAVDKLKDYADEIKKAITSIQQNIERIQAPSPGSDERDLLSALRRTRETADKFGTEAAYVLEKRQAGSITRALMTHFRYVKKKNILLILKSELEDCNRVTKLMLTNRNIKQSDAILFQRSKDFSDLSDQIKAQVQQLIEQQAEAADMAQENHREVNANFADLSLNVYESHAKTRDHVDQAFARHAEVESNSRAHQQLLESLEFPDMWQRQNQIADPDDASFTESYFMGDLDRDLSEGSEASESDDRTSNDPSVSVDERSEEELRKREREKAQKEVREAIGGLRKWMDTGTTPFWISGHAGSGKSTLVKFLVDQERQHSTQHPQLRKEVLVHYFWRAGSGMQQNEKGTLCALIHQLLQNHTQRSGALLREGETVSRKKQVSDWSISELRGTFIKLVADTSSTVIIFMDGLDEIAEDGDLYHLLETLKWQQQFPNCRLCISSRPEFIIQKHLSAYPTIRVQELTYLNMSSYVTRKLDEAIATRGWNKADVRKLFSTIVQKAEGIFLWLVLVTDAIRRSIWLGKDYDDVLERVNVLPTKLEALFTDMWERMGDDFASDRKLAASYINALVVHGQLARRVEHNFIEARFRGRPTLFSILLTVHPGSADKLFGSRGNANRADQFKWLQAKRDEMISHCLGLVICQQDDRFRVLLDGSRTSSESVLLGQDVLFVHRSAYDFFVQTEAGQAIRSKSEIPVVHSYLAPAIALAHEARFILQVYDVSGMYASQLFFDQAILAMTGLSEAAILPLYPTISAQIPDLLYNMCDSLDEWFRTKCIFIGFYALAINGLEHVLDMLAVPSIASTKIGAHVFCEYCSFWTMCLRGKHPPVIPPLEVVSKMLEAGANPHQPIRRRRSQPECKGAFGEFLLETWLTLQHNLNCLDTDNVPPTCVDGSLAALSCFLEATPNVDLAVRHVINLSGPDKYGIPGLITKLTRCSASETIAWGLENDGNKSNDGCHEDDYRQIRAIFSVDQGWVCRRILAFARTREPLGQFGEDDLAFLPHIEQRLDLLEEQQDYQVTGMKLSYVFLYVAAEDALFYRDRSNVTSSAAIEAMDYISKQLEPRLGEDKLAANVEILRALSGLLWAEDLGSYLGMEGGKARMGKLPTRMRYDWSQNSGRVHRIDLKSAEKCPEGLAMIRCELSDDGVCDVRLEDRHQKWHQV